MTDPSPAASAPPGSAPDAFFVQQDCKTLFQRRLTEIAKAAGVILPAALRGFHDALGEGYDLLAAAARRAGFEQADGLTSSRITLMGDDDLELEIRIGDITRRLGDIGGTALWKAHLRYMTLLRRPEMDKDQNPVGPQAIAEGLWVLGRDGGGSLEERLGVLARFEAACRDQLPAFYDELNDLLARHGVEPAVIQAAAGAPRAPAHAAAAAEGQADPLAALQTTLARQAGAAGGGGEGAGNVALSAATLVMLNQLLARLDALPLAGGEGAANPPHGITARELGLAPGGSDAVAIDTLGHIFDAIFGRPDLPEAVKDAIGRLQIPLLKAAIADPAFFANAEHPARRLINGMGRAALGLPRAAGRDHPVCAGLARIAAAVLEAREEDGGGLAPALAAVEALVGERDAAAAEAAQSCLPLALTLERRSQALAAARAWAAGVEARGVPAVVARFIDDEWVPVMQAAWLEGGETGPRWQEDAAAIADLLWSIEPKPAVEDRKRLAALVPSLLKRLNAGLDRLGVSPEARAPFLDACFALQTAALRGVAPPAAMPEPAVAEPAADATVETLELAGRRLLSLGTARDGRSPYRAGAAPGTLGDWLEFRLPDGDTRCGRISWLSPATGLALLGNPDWSEGVALTPAAAEARMRAGEARVASAARLFDEAADAALRQLGRS